MRNAFSFYLSAMLICPTFAQSTSQSGKEAQDKPSEALNAVKTLKQPLAFGLEDGTPVKLRITRNLSSADAKTGDKIDFEVLEDIKVKDVILIPRGGIAWG